MRIRVERCDPAQAGTVVLFAYAKPRALPAGAVEDAARALPWLEESGAYADFQGGKDEIAVAYGPQDKARVILIGLGPRKDFKVEGWREACARAARKCRDLRVTEAVFPLWACPALDLPPETLVFEAALAFRLALYRFEAFKTRDKKPIRHPQTLTLAPERKRAALTQAVKKAEAVAAGINLARDLSTAPANQATPAFMVEAARNVAQARDMTFTVLDAFEAEQLGMGAFTAVAKGSREPGAVAILDYAPAGTEKDKPFVLIGKGVTFDTGGISLKPAAGMELMKRDMAGAAAVLGAIDALAAMGVRRRVVGILPLAENMPDGGATRPGDIVRTLKGLTVEIVNTDAEGRLLLCDSLAYAARFDPAAIIDVATLTGACVVALGEYVAGLMGNRETFVRKLHKLSLEVGERTWPLPTWDFYLDALKSEAADLRNVGDRKGGAIHAALFLAQFVPEGVPWAHLDIAGPAWLDKDTPLTPKGASGFGVRTLVAAVEAM